LRLFYGFVLATGFVACAPIGPATREGFGVPYPSLAAARAAADSAGVPILIAVDTIVLSESDSPPPDRDIARVRLLRGRPDGCATEARVRVPCPSVIFIETRRPQWQVR